MMPLSCTRRAVCRSAASAKSWMVPLRTQARFSCTTGSVSASKSAPFPPNSMPPPLPHRNPGSPSLGSTSAHTTTSSGVQPPVDLKRFIGMTGAQIFHELLIHHKVKQVFGYPGGAILPVFDAIYNSKHFNFTLPRHEQGGGHMAEGYARACGKPGVLLVTSGPGATNAVTPMQDALSDGTPLIVFSGQVASHLLGTDAFQEADVVGITKACTKWNVMVKDVKQIPRIMNEAFFIATSGRPGPVLVDLPKDITGQVLKELPEWEPQIPDKYLPVHYEGKVSDVDIQRIAKLVNGAKRPLIYAGQGIISADCSDLLKKLAEQGNIPVTTTLLGLGGFNEFSPLSLHMLGMHGSAYANYAMQHADVIISLGARFDDRVTGNISKFAPEAYKAAKEGRGGIVQFDILPRNINKVVKVHEPVLGDIKENLLRILPSIKSSPRSEWLDKLAGWKTAHPWHYTPAIHDGALKPQAVLKELNDQIHSYRDNVVFTTGVGQHQMWTAQWIRWTSPRSMISSGGAGTMGFGLPAAIGAKLAQPKKMVIDVDGDASLLMTAMELMTAVQYKIGVKVLILNNNFLGMVKQWQDLFYEERYSQTEMTNPDFQKLAEAFGAKGLTVSRMEDLPRVMDEFLKHEGPVVLNAVVEKDEHVYPMVASGKGLDEMVLTSTAKVLFTGQSPPS